ncbi:MAG: DUF58 domain-containing protein [Anaerolineae bacterium]|nr:DUF58 domain-containing protein [Anaerolineae bacterium]
MLTPRWLVLALIIPLLLIAAESLPFLTVAALIYALALLLFTLLDRRAAGAADQFVIRREHEEKLSLGVPNSIRLEINTSRLRTLELTLLDEPPRDFILNDAAQFTLTSPWTEKMVSVQYRVTPRKRGDFSFGDINLRWSGPLRLFKRQSVIKAAMLVKVYPNIQAIKQFELLARNQQLTELGLINARLRDQGTEFESLREYTPDDPYRSINWKATARHGKPISMDYEPDRHQRVMICLDIGRMMQSILRSQQGMTFTPSLDTQTAPLDMAKLDFAINSLLLLSYVASRRGEHIGLTIFADKVQQFLPTKAGTRHFGALLEAMYALTSQPVESDYERLVNFLSSRQQKRALTIIFTDLSGARAAESLIKNLPRLAPRHLPLLVTIRDPMLDREASKPIAGSPSVYERMVAEQFLSERRVLLSNLERRGVLTLDVDAARLSASVINRYLALKARL